MIVGNHDDKDTCLGLIHLRKEMLEIAVRIFSNTAKKRGVLQPDTSQDLSTNQNDKAGNSRTVPG